MEACTQREIKSTESTREKVILIGNPNVGKSVIFNYLTGKYVTVSNYPGTTVEVATGTLSAHGKKFEVLDTPGVNSLIPMSEDEKVTRDILLKEPKSHLVQVMDTKNIRRGLLISLQLVEMGLPFIVLLNMWDEAKSRGIEIKIQTLSEILGAPILKTVATRQKGLEKIKENLQAHPSSSLSINYPDAIESSISRIIPLLPEASISRRSLALMLLSGDESLAEWLHTPLSDHKILQIEEIRQEIQTHFAEPIGYLINQARLRKVDELLSQVMKLFGEAPKSVSSFLGSLSMHPLWGFPILLFILWITYAIAIVFPIVGCFFLVFGLMDDSGYLPRLAVMTNQVFKKMGLNGKAVLPMVLGLGCDTMATMTTRILDTEKDRTIVTLLLALGVPCSAQLGVILGMFAGLPLIYISIWVLLLSAIIVMVGYLASRVL